MSALGRPLVVHHTITPCPGCDRDIAVITDGTRVTANSGIDYHTTDPERFGTVLTLRCGAPCGCGSRDCGDICRARITVDLTTEWWTTARVLIDWLEREGEPVERLDA